MAKAIDVIGSGKMTNADKAFKFARDCCKKITKASVSIEKTTTVGFEWNEDGSAPEWVYYFESYLNAKGIKYSRNFNRFIINEEI